MLVGYLNVQIKISSQRENKKEHVFLQAILSRSESVVKYVVTQLIKETPTHKTNIIAKQNPSNKEVSINKKANRLVPLSDIVSY